MSSVSGDAEPLTREQRLLNAFLAQCMRDGLDGQAMADAMIDVLRQGGHIDATGNLLE